MTILAEPVAARAYETITDEQRLHWWMDRARATGLLSFDTETDGLNAHECQLVGLSMAVRTPDGNIDACYVPVGHSSFVATKQIALQAALNIVAPVLANPMITKVMQNGKFDRHVLRRYGVEIASIEDTMLLSYSQFGGKHRHNMDELAKLYLDYTTIKFNEVTGSGAKQVTFDMVELEPATAYAAEDADVTLALEGVLRAELRKDEQSVRLYETIERPFSEVAFNMEQRGICVDVPYLDSLTEKFTAEMNRCLDRMYELNGEPFNPGSPPQVALFLQNLGVELVERTEKGKIATGVKVIENVKEWGDLPSAASEAVDLVLEWRKFAKLVGTYTEALPRAINPNTGRVHTSYGLASTATGRLASSEPNLQNIPIRTDEGQLIRAAFVADAGKLLISADYSQVELRIAAHIANEQAMIEAFLRGHDIHQAMAAEINGIQYEAVTKGQRRDAKAVNFGILYGTTKYGLSRNLKITEGEAEALIERYFARFPGIKGYMDWAQERAHALGYVRTKDGRRIWVPDINSKNKGRRGHAERAAINAPIQGTAADIIKKAMIRLEYSDELRALGVEMLLQVHDEVIFEVPEQNAQTAIPIITGIMSGVEQLRVPLLVEAQAAKSWQDAH